MYVYIYIYMHICIYIYIYICIHIHGVGGNCCRVKAICASEPPRRLEPFYRLAFHRPRWRSRCPLVTPFEHAS